MLRGVKKIFKFSPKLHDLCTDASSELYYEELDRKQQTAAAWPVVSWIDEKEPGENLRHYYNF